MNTAERIGYAIGLGIGALCIYVFVLPFIWYNAQIWWRIITYLWSIVA